MPKCPKCDKEVYFGRQNVFILLALICIVFVCFFGSEMFVLILTVFTHAQIFGLIRKYKSAASQRSSLKYFSSVVSDILIYIFVTFSAAERKTSLGKDWHSFCLKCEKCNKVLMPGAHAEHEGKPYCNQPCYSALFGPGGTCRYIFLSHPTRTLDLIACAVHNYQIE
jgi:LIM domain